MYVCKPWKYFDTIWFILNAYYAQRNLKGYRRKSNSEVLKYFCDFPTHRDAHAPLCISGQMYSCFTTDITAVALDGINKERTMRRG